MANLTLLQARAKVLQFLDDASNRRWSDAQIDDALTDALSTCINRYALSGGDRFDLEVTGTTSASTGSVSLSAVLPARIKQVAVVVGNTTYRLTQKDPLRRGYADLVARDLRVLYVREYALPTDTGHPLVGVGATAANSWPAFDKWLCLEAANQLGLKDLEQKRLMILREAGDRAEQEALARAPTPGGYPIPRREWNPLYGDLYWQMVQPSTVYLTRVRW